MGSGGKGGGGGGPSKKTVEKEKKKIIEDKTFGLKNKNKSAKVQKYVANVEKTVQQAGKKKPEKRAEPAPKAVEDINLFTPIAVTQKKIEPGVDPKSLLCEYFKAGNCVRGTKCKFSHDLAVERRSEKIDLYTDQRDLKEEGSAETMENWDQAELERVVKQRHGQNNRTEIVCKYFLDAIEKKKYGWFWECPNGESCGYRHALPPGFVLVSKKKEPEEEVEEIPIEEQIEEERKLLKTHTPLTLELFLEWKERKRKAAEEKRAEEERKRKTDINTGRAMMSGREMFVFNPELFIDDEGAMEVDELAEEQIDESIPHNIVTATATSLSLTRVNKQEENNNNNAMTVDVDGVPVQWLLFMDDEGLPPYSDDEDEQESNNIDN